MIYRTTKNINKVICWWSGGVTSAVACKIAIDIFGKDVCRVIMIDTKNEDVDSYRFLKDCSKWYGLNIEVITGIKSESVAPNETYVDIGESFKSIQDVWRKYKSLNVANGAICSSILKRKVREAWQKSNSYDFQVFGYEFDKKEMNRALSFSINYPNAKSIFPLLMLGYNKPDCIKIIEDAKIQIPQSYVHGFLNNNCLQTGCVQGGIGYWQRMKLVSPDKFIKMADIEHELTKLKGKPVTMLKDQSNYAKEKVESSGVKWNNLVFLKKHPQYPDLKCIDDFKQQLVNPLFECNGYCGTNDLLESNSTQHEINFSE